MVVRVAFVCVLLMLAGRAEAQTRPVGPGSRIMVWTDSRVGPLDVVSADGSVVEAQHAGGQRVKLDLSEARRIDVSRGRRTAVQGAGRGLMFGALVGGVAGAAFGFADGDDPPGILSFTAGEKAVLMGALGGGSGAVIGALLGALNPGEAWTRADVPVRVGPGPHGAGMSLRLAVRF